MIDFRKAVRDEEDAIIKVRRALHRIPETAFCERKTSAFVANHLNRMGLKVETGVAETGVVGLLELGKRGKTLMIRADMDALPLPEETGLPFASTHDGFMHACGHDAHMAMALGAASILSKIKEGLKGNIKFVFQPAEEGPGGAKPMIDAGVLESPKVDLALGCHLHDGHEGTIGVKAGRVLAANDRFDLRILGKGGHGAMPHLCVDPIDVGVQVINALQRISSRHVNPMSPIVLTIGSFHAGSGFNIIPSESDMTGTTRTFDRRIWDSWQERMEKIIKGICEAMGAGYEFKYHRGYPPTVNDEALVEIVRRCAAEVVGEGNVFEPEPIMAGDDMSYFLERVPGFFFFLGAGFEGSAPLHNSRFDFHEEILATGVEMYLRLACELLN
ncbi:MAG: amidohydrolase [Deltaproteobacteria bacterium]|nr:amidohydrolase [Deltaproteobacteria bacterium]